MVKHRFLIIGLLLACLQLQCGSGPLVIDVDVPVDQTSPFQELLTTAGAGIYFHLDALIPNPTGIDQVQGAATIAFPSAAPFMEPSTTAFDLSSLDLEPNTPYRITMFGTVNPAAVADEASAKYKGVGDCPVIKNLGDQNNVHICFGLKGENAVCVDTVAFSNCPK